MPHDSPTDPATDPATVVLDLVRVRGPGKTICPSEAARRLARAGEDWRVRMPVVRDVAAGLQRQGLIVVTQRGLPVDLRTAKGAVRLGLPPDVD